jgi:tetratricopeptide (TPR) repeat protein
MAKRRINQKFLALLGGGVLAIAALGVGALKFKSVLFPKHPEKYLSAGREALAKKDYATARDNLARAAVLSQPNAALDVMMGDALNGLASKDPDNVAAARAIWEQALTIDPSNIDAMERLVQFWREQLELRPRAKERGQVAGYLRKAAQRLIDADPQNHVGRVNEAEAAIEAIADGVQSDAALATSVATAKEQTLLQAQAEDPVDADIPYYVARAYLWQSQQAARSDDTDRQGRLIASAKQVMADAVSAQPDDASLRYRHGQILLQIAAGDLSAASPSAETKDTVSAAFREIDQARALVTPEDPRYIEIGLFDARLALNRPDYAPAPHLVGHAAPVAPAPTSATPAAIGSIAANELAAPARVRVAESIYRDMLAHRPNDPQTVVALAELLGNLSDRRAEAISLLVTPLVDENPAPGLRGTLLPMYQSLANIRLLSLQIDAAEASGDPGKRSALIATADALCDRVYARSPDSPQVLGLKGRLELVHGQVVEATQTLRRALSLTDPNDIPTRLSRYELMFNLARAAEAAQQTGDAKKLASDVVTAYPHFIPARLMLARLLITEHDFADATPQIDYLESILPAHPELSNMVARMRIATLDLVKDADRIRQYYDKLPERTRDQQMDKAAFARLVKYDDDALRLLTLVHAASPGDVEAARALAVWYDTHGQKSKAMDVLDEALAVNPSDSTLLALQMQIQGVAGVVDGGPTAAGVQQATPEATQPAGGDPFSNEWAQVQVERSHGDLAAVDAHLAAAEKLKPNEPRIWDAIFTRALESADWDRASTYLEKLSSANIDHAGGALYHVNYFLARNDMQKASELAQQLTHDKPEFSQTWCVLGKVQKAQGKYQDAMSSFQQALQRQVQNLEAIHGMIDCAYALGDTEQAKRYIDEGRRVAPGNESFKELQLNYELTYGDPQNVIPTRLAELQAAPDVPQAWINLANAYVAAAQSRARAQDAVAASDYYQKADTLLQQAIAKWPDTTRFVVFDAKLALDRSDFPAGEKVMLAFVRQPSQMGTPRAATLLSEFYDLAGKEDLAIKAMSDYLATPYQPVDHAADVAAEVRLAGLLAKVNRFDDALTALSANAQDPAITRQKVEVLIKAGRFADADKTLDAFAAVSPLSPELLSLRGVAKFDEGNLAGARICFDQVIAAEPNNVYALTQRAQISLRDVPSDPQSATADLVHARDLAPANMETRLLLVEADKMRGRSVDAIQELESALHVVPADKQARLELIHLYANSNPPRWDDANRVLQETHQIPSLADDADVAHEEAAVDLGQGEYSKADQLIRMAMDKVPGNVAMVHTYYDILLRTKQFDQLLAHSAQLLATNRNAPALWWAYPYRAQALFHSAGDRAGAAAELEHGLDAAAAAKDPLGSAQIIQTYASLLGPDEAIKAAAQRAQADPHWLLLAANLCRAKGDADAAIQWLETALDRLDKLTPADQDATLRMAAQEYLAKAAPDPLKSVDMYHRLLKRSPNDVESLNNLACILVEQGPAYQPKEALGCSEKAYNLMIQQRWDDPMIKDTYGWTLIANGRSEEGFTLVQDALGKRDFPEGHYHLAEALLKRQPPSVEEATAELDKAQQMLDQDGRDGKPVDIALKSHVQEELKRARSGLAG